MTTSLFIAFLLFRTKVHRMEVTVKVIVGCKTPLTGVQVMHYDDTPVEVVVMTLASAAM